MDGRSNGFILVIAALAGALGCSSSAQTPSDGGNAPDSSGSSVSDGGADVMDGEAGLGSDAPSCVPCVGNVMTTFGNQFKCTQVKDPSPGAIQGATVYLQPMPQAGGTCVIGGITLLCGGTGTFADCTPLTWTLANGVVTFQDSTRVFTCMVQ
jgi:hypothetical protein